MRVSTTDLSIYQNDDFRALLNYLNRFSSRIYLVGGFVRDLFLGCISGESADLDIELYDVSPQKFDEIMQSFGAQGVGKSYFVYKYKNFDISLPRTESKTGIGHKGFSVALAADEREASKRRDFTINSIMLNALNGEILDFYGGISDIKSRVLRLVDERSFKEDSLRVFRAVQFAARFNLQIEPKTLQIMRAMDTSDLSRERIKCELIKLFGAKFCSVGLGALQKLGLFHKIFGTRISDERCAELGAFIDQGKALVQSDMFFLYALLNLLRLNKQEILKDLGLNALYKRVIDEPFYAEINDEILCKIALKMPLKRWLGLYTPARVKAAQRLGIYEAKFKSAVSGAQLAREGFSGTQIGKELASRQEAEIKAFLAGLKA